MKNDKTKENIQTIGEVLKNGTREVANDDKNICPYCKKPKITKKYSNFSILMYDCDCQTKMEEAEEIRKKNFLR